MINLIAVILATTIGVYCAIYDDMFGACFMFFSAGLNIYPVIEKIASNSTK